MIGSGSAWNGSIVKGQFTDKFKIVDTNRNELFDIVEVTVLFFASPTKTYVFEIPAEKYDGSKAAVGREILEQLSNG